MSRIGERVAGVVLIVASGLGGFAIGHDRSNDQIGTNQAPGMTTPEAGIAPTTLAGAPEVPATTILPPTPTLIKYGNFITCAIPKEQAGRVVVDDRALYENGTHGLLKAIDINRPDGVSNLTSLPQTVAYELVRGVALDNNRPDIDEPAEYDNFPVGTYEVAGNCVYNGPDNNGKPFTANF